jgi:hypothetical protein
MLWHFGTLEDHFEARDLRVKLVRELSIYLLTAGFSRSYHQQVLGVSDTTIATYMSWSRQLAEKDRKILDAARANAASITAEDGLIMAQRRRRAHMPWWSRLAIAEYAHQLGDTAEVARLFNCSRRTVQLVTKTWPLAYDPFTGERKLSSTQIDPPGRWSRSA